MATTSLTLVGNSAGSRELDECRDTLYCNASSMSRERLVARRLHAQTV